MFFLPSWFSKFYSCLFKEHPLGILSGYDCCSQIIIVSLHFRMSWSLPSFLKDIFTEYRITGWYFFYATSFWPPCFLSRSLLSLSFFSTTGLSHKNTFKYFSVSLVFIRLTMKLYVLVYISLRILFGVYSVSWIFYLSPNLESFQPLVFWIFF